MRSTHKSDYGEFKWTAGEFYGDAEKDKGERLREREGEAHHGVNLLPSFQESRPVKMPSSTPGVHHLNPSLTKGRPSSFSSLSNTNRRLTAAEAM